MTPGLIFICTDFSTIKMDVSILLQVLVSIIAIILAYIALKENKLTRKASFKPVLIPGDFNDFDTFDRLFVYNFEYPLTEDVGEAFMLAHLGLRNIGKGPAVNVTAIRFQIIEDVNSDEAQEPVNDDESISFRSAYQTANIQEGCSIPLIFRIANETETDCYNTVYSITVTYHDIFNESFFLSLRFFIEGDRVVVLEYNDQKNPIWDEGYKAPFREAESYGFYEMEQIREKESKRYK
jgi:hypothetical protein